MFFSNVSALSAPSVPLWDGVGRAEAGAALQLPTTARAEACWGSPKGSAEWGQKGSGLSDAWLSPAERQPQLLCDEGNGAPLAGGDTCILVLTPERELVLQRERSNCYSPSHSSPSHARAVLLHQHKGE